MSKRFGVVWCCGLLALSVATGWAAPKKLLEGPFAEDGRFDYNNGAKVAEGAVAVEVTADDEWHEYLVSVPDKVVLAPEGVYRIAYDYTVTKDLSGEEPYFYHLLRAGDAGDNDRGWETWTAKSGEKGRRQFTARLAKLPSYRLILGVRRAGGIRISNLLIEDLTPGPGIVFAPYFMADDERLALNNNATVVKGGVEVDTTDDGEEWHEYLHTEPARVALASGGRYKISYDYTVSKALAGDGAAFYHLVRTADADKDRGMELWQAAAGAKGHKEFTVELDKADGYYLILGVRFKGGIRIDNLEIEDLNAKK